MIKNYLKVAWRSLIRNKTQTFINLAGLSVGIACSLLILLWIQNELSIDSFHKSNLYTVYERQFYDHKMHGSYNTPGIMADEMKKVIPEVQYATSMAFGEKSTFQVGDKKLKIDGNSASADYFKMFNYHLLQGTPQTALNSPVSIAISRKMARQFYGSPEAAIGKIIRYENKENFTITAVFEDLPKNVSQRFDFLINWPTFLTHNLWAKKWDNQGPFTYISLRQGANPALVDKKITRFLDTYNSVDRRTATFIIDLALQPFGETYLHGNIENNGKPEGGRIEYVHLFSIVAVFILLIACINFMNLTTARSVKRAREIGVRKVAGALRLSLIKQFITESLLITSIAVLISLVIIALLLPFFNQITQKQLSVPYNQTFFWLMLMAITLITGLISGSYPALYLSSFNPIKVLKGSIESGPGAILFRKGLVIFQFVLSVILITGTIIVSRQMNYIQSKNLGYDRENLLYIPLEGELINRYKVFKNEALNKPGIQSVTLMSKAPQDIYGSTGGVDWIDRDPTVNILFTQIAVGYDFVKTMKLQLLAGRDFSKDYPTDSAGYLINEAALKVIGYKDPIGKPFTLWGKKGKIIGLLKDFHFHSLHEQIGPILIRAGENENGSVVLVRTQPGKTTEALASLESLSRELNPAFPPSYYFVDEEYQKLYQSEQIVNKLSNAFAFLAIFISCLGLLGLAIYTAEQRVKEIGIRKVLGASVSSLFALLSSEFLKLVIISLFIASPIAWFAMSKWLQTFAYRTPLQWWVFVVSGGLIMLIALATVSFQALKAALINPIKSLRSE